MCGIFFVCSTEEHADPDDVVLSALRARGPDSLNIHHARTRATASDTAHASHQDTDHYLTFISSVLSLRGDHVHVQPLVDTHTGSVLCWNGEAWKIDGNQVCGNDTEQIFQLLLNASASITGDRELLEVCPSKVAQVLTQVAGPYALVYYDASHSTIYYARDKLGRRSLVLNQPGLDANEVSISSMGFGMQPSTEVKTDGIYYIDLKASEINTRHVPWPTPDPSINTITPFPDEALSATPSPDTVVALTQHLSEAVRLRVANVPTYTANSDSPLEPPSRIAVLFSGGLDCTLIARVAHDILPTDQPIDLLNVAFENPRTVKAFTAQSKRTANPPDSFVSPYEACPDRITARQSFAELIATCPSRVWRLVAIDVPYTETLAHRNTIINLMSPHNTEMDLSITLALYFAARGRGHYITSSSSQQAPATISNAQPYTTTARVLLSGLGADELFGGYARHAASFTRAGYAGLNAELELDISRIGTRNLGRDDRVLAHWGREVRYPFLDEDFVAFALALPAWEKTGFRPGTPVAKHFEGAKNMADSNGDATTGKEEDLDPAKMLLRCAAWELGMKRVAHEKKRAIQFGARTAKMEGGRTKGTDLLVSTDTSTLTHV